ncbi:hypothetical protein D0Z00_003976 [Geotrichum galactomycetum]|uniref:Uncharacterized protein n=1 Tax=Geotrichum galactomycetum TaxID=27317 RepID=A0ACB6UZQ5_9ASCO|nr:hypothetical protein D0Z00_003976 [Geotrichum candidum]
MRFSLSALKPIQVTFFTKPSCGLCEAAKANLSKAWDRAPTKFDYQEVDISKPENKKWYDVYAFDIPVVHFDGIAGNGGKSPLKLMHKIETEKVLEILKESENKV